VVFSRKLGLKSQCRFTLGVIVTKESSLFISSINTHYDPAKFVVKILQGRRAVWEYGSGSTCGRKFRCGFTGRKTDSLGIIATTNTLLSWLLRIKFITLQFY
jgi:hypothetical protein